jgi:hypothetical protein
VICANAGADASKQAANAASSLEIIKFGVLIMFLFQITN